MLGTLRIRAGVARLARHLPAAREAFAQLHPQQPCLQAYPPALAFRQAPPAPHRAFITFPLSSSAASHALRALHQRAVEEGSAPDAPQAAASISPESHGALGEGEQSGSHSIALEGEQVESHGAPGEGEEPNSHSVVDIEARDHAVSDEASEPDVAEVDVTFTEESRVIAAGGIPIPDDMPQVDPPEDAELAEIDAASVEESIEEFVAKTRRRRGRRGRREETEERLEPTSENIVAAAKDIAATSPEVEPVSQLEFLCNRFRRDLVINYNVLAMRPRFVIEATLELLVPSKPKVVLAAGRGESFSKKTCRQLAATALFQSLQGESEGASIKGEAEEEA